MSSVDAKKTSAVGAYAQFATDPDLEKNGIVLDYGTYYIRIARAGGANLKFARVSKMKFEPHRRAIQTDTLSDKIAEKLVRESYAEAVLLGWGYKANEDDEKFIDGKFPNAEGVELDFNVGNVVQVMTDLPDLFKDVQEQAIKVSLFRKTVLEADAKNS